MAVLLALAVALSSHGIAKPIRPLTPPERTAIVAAGEYHSGCPVSLSRLRVLTVLTYGFDHRTHRGQIVVNAQYAKALRTVFVRLYQMRFPIRHMRFSDTYGGPYPKDGDVTASFECRQAAASPCAGLGNKRTGSWSNHAYGLAVDLDPRENPYVGCGMTRDKTALSYLNRARHRPGMVTPTVVRLFASIGWGWGGSWTGSTKDYMHFSYNGH